MLLLHDARMFLLRGWGHACTAAGMHAMQCFKNEWDDVSWCYTKDMLTLPDIRDRQVSRSLLIEKAMSDQKLRQCHGHAAQLFFNNAMLLFDKKLQATAQRQPQHGYNMPKHINAAASAKRDI